MAGCSNDGQPRCKKRLKNATAARLLDTSMEMELKLRNDLLELDALHAGMRRRLAQLGNKLKRKQDAAEKLQITIKNITDEIETCKNEQDNMQTDRRKLENQTTYYDFCKHLLYNEPENSNLWYFTGTECPICLEKYEDMARLNHCKHLLCVKCLTFMFKTSFLCPLCRCEIIGYDVFDRTLLCTEYVTVTQHHERISNVVHPSADGPGLQLRNDMYGLF